MSKQTYSAEQLALIEVFTALSISYNPVTKMMAPMKMKKSLVPIRDYRIFLTYVQSACDQNGRNRYLDQIYNLECFTAIVAGWTQQCAEYACAVAKSHLGDGFMVALDPQFTEWAKITEEIMGILAEYVRTRPHPRSLQFQSLATAPVEAQNPSPATNPDFSPNYPNLTGFSVEAPIGPIWMESRPNQSESNMPLTLPLSPKNQQVLTKVKQVVCDASISFNTANLAATEPDGKRIRIFALSSYQEGVQLPYTVVFRHKERGWLQNNIRFVPLKLENLERSASLTKGDQTFMFDIDDEKLFQAISHQGTLLQHQQDVTCHKLRAVLDSNSEIFRGMKSSSMSRAQNVLKILDVLLAAIDGSLSANVIQSAYQAGGFYLGGTEAYPEDPNDLDRFAEKAIRKQKLFIPNQPAKAVSSGTVRALGNTLSPTRVRPSIQQSPRINAL